MIGLFVGSYEHDEDYLGPQGNNYPRGFWMLPRNSRRRLPAHVCSIELLGETIWPLIANTKTTSTKMSQTKLWQDYIDQTKGQGLPLPKPRPSFQHSTPKSVETTRSRELRCSRGRSLTPGGFDFYAGNVLKPHPASPVQGTG